MIGLIMYVILLGNKGYIYFCNCLKSYHVLRSKFASFHSVLYVTHPGQTPGDPWSERHCVAGFVQ